MSKYLNLEVISMLQNMQGDSSLWRGLITIVAKRCDVACSTVYWLWEWAAHTCTAGDIISQVINSQKKFQEASYISERVCPGGCQECPTVEEAYPKKTCNVNVGVKDNCAPLDCCFDHSGSL